MKYRQGQSLLEVLIGLGLGALFIIAGAGLIAPALQTNKQVKQVQANTQLANELVENIKAWSVGHWDTLLTLATGSTNTYYLNTTSSPFSIPGTSPPPTSTESVSFVGTTFTRYFYLSDVYRDSSGYVTSTASGNAHDPSTKKAKGLVQKASSSTSAPTFLFYLTRNI